jgi:RimJ/RimL family protein N-acetyltransferase
MEHSPPVSVPRLETPRLRLREFKMADFDAFAAHLADPVSTSFVTKADRRDAWRIFGCVTGMWLLQGAGWWALEARATGEVVGNVGAFYREGWPEMELGWNVYRAFWKRGYASEAAAEVVRYALEVRKERRVIALIDPANAPSVRVADRLGMRHEADVELFGKTVGRYSLPAGLHPPESPDRPQRQDGQHAEGGR